MKKTSLIERAIVVGTLVSWTGVLWLLFIGKILLSDDGAAGYFRHFTNWSWTLSAVFFLVDVVTYTLPKRATHFVRFQLAAYGFWLVNGAAWLVFWIVFVILNDNPRLLQNISDDGGYSLGLVYCMDRIVHVLPPIALWLYASFRRNYFYAVMYSWFRVLVKRKSDYYKLLWITYLGVSVLAPVPILLIYWLIFDINNVYGLQSPTLVLTAIGAAVLLTSNLIPLTVLYHRSREEHAPIVVAEETYRKSKSC